MEVSIWAIGAVIAAGQALLLAAVLFLKKENRLPNRLLGVLLLLLAVTLVEWALWWTLLIEQMRGWKLASLGFQWLYGPLLLLYFEATFERKPLRWRSLLHLLPFAAVVFSLLPFYLRFYENLAAAVQWIPTLVRRPWYPVPAFGQMIGYGVWITLRLRPYVREHGELERWGRWLLLGYRRSRSSSSPMHRGGAGCCSVHLANRRSFFAAGAAPGGRGGPPCLRSRSVWDRVRLSILTVTTEEKIFD